MIPRDTNAAAGPVGRRGIRRLRLGSWATSVVMLFAAVMGGVVVASVASYAILPSSGTSIGGARPWSTALVAAAFILSGAAVAGRLPRNPLGWLLLGVAFATTVDTASWVFAHRWQVAGWATGTAWWPAISLAIPLLLLFPTGRLPSRRWRPALWAATLGVAVPTVGLAAMAILEPRRLFEPRMALYGWAAAWRGVSLAGAAVCLVAACLALASLVGRWRSATGVERQQLKWLGISAVVFFLGLLGELGRPGALYLGLAAIPVALAIAILRFRLYDLDLYLNRALVYGALTGGLVLFYVLVVGVVSSAFAGQNRLGPPLVATGVIAVGFQPARHWLQRRIDRLIYGDRGDPFSVVAALGQLLGKIGTSEEVLPRVVETISSKLQLPFVAVEVIGPDGSSIVVEHGRRVVAPMAFRMTYQGVQEGNLLISPRSPGEQFSGAERRLLEALADQVAPVAHSVQLTTALRRSRERVVRSREEERRRLRRDLHDGLGPILSGLRLGIEGVARRSTLAEMEADALARLARQADAGRDEVRRLINDLRPDALDSLGLVGAIEETAGRFEATRADGHPTRFEVRAHDLPENLPAAVEVATYWIVTEAMHNVLRHANAERCSVSLSCDHEALEVLVKDNGNGLAADRPTGVGTTSMRERAEEIGGRCSVQNDPGGGTRVFARLPIGQR